MSDTHTPAHCSPELTALVDTLIRRARTAGIDDEINTEAAAKVASDAETVAKSALLHAIARLEQDKARLEASAASVARVEPADLMLYSKEHYELMENFERLYKGLRMDREDKSLWGGQAIYQSGETNRFFLTYRHGYMLGKAISSTPEVSHG